MLGFLGGGASHTVDNSDQSDDDDLSDAVDGVSCPIHGIQHSVHCIYIHVPNR